LVLHGCLLVLAGQLHVHLVKLLPNDKKKEKKKKTTQMEISAGHSSFQIAAS
jgi:hypothetical protein